MICFIYYLTTIILKIIIRKIFSLLKFVKMKLFWDYNSNFLNNYNLFIILSKFLPKNLFSLQPPENNRKTQLFRYI